MAAGVAQVIAAHPNIAKQLHMPAQSGSSAVLAAMRRGHDRPAYDALVRRVRSHLPQAGPDLLLSTLGGCVQVPAGPPCTCPRAGLRHLRCTRVTHPPATDGRWCAEHAERQPAGLGRAAEPPA